MSNREDRIAALVDRAMEERTMCLAKFIEKENLYEYELGYEDILYADDLNNAVIPCEDRMILAREYYDEEQKQITAEYAIYTQHDRDGEMIPNSLNMNAVYKLEWIGEETFTNMAYAIAHAANIIRTIAENDRNMKGE